MYTNKIIAYYLENRNNSFVRVTSWVFVFFLMLWWTQLFRSGMFHPANIILNGFGFIPVIGFYYLFKCYVFPLIKQKRWFAVGSILLLSYFVSVFFDLLPLYIAYEIFPDDNWIKSYRRIYGINNLTDLFNKFTFLWFVTISFWCNIATISAYVAMNLFLAQKNRLLALQARDNMEIGFLRAQIQPHFLFNTFNNIYGLVIDREEESDVILKLSDMMRYSLYECRQTFVYLEKEIQFIKNYLELENARLRSKGVHIFTSWREEDFAGMRVSPLFLAQFLESVLELLAHKEGDKIIDVQLRNVGETIYLGVKQQVPIRQDSIVDRSDLPDFWLRRAELEYPDKYEIAFRCEEKIREITLILNISTEDFG